MGTSAKFKKWMELIILNWKVGSSFKFSGTIKERIKYQRELYFWNEILKALKAPNEFISLMLEKSQRKTPSKVDSKLKMEIEPFPTETDLPLNTSLTENNRDLISN